MKSLQMLLVVTLGWLALPVSGWAYYNSESGRWLSRDPIEENGGANAYSGAENNPLDKIDTDGAKTSKPWEDYWRDWQANHPWLSPAQLDWCEQQLARGCVGVTCANLGAEEDLSRCYKK